MIDSQHHPGHPPPQPPQPARDEPRWLGRSAADKPATGVGRAASPPHGWRSRGRETIDGAGHPAVIRRPLSSPPPGPEPGPFSFARRADLMTGRFRSALALAAAWTLLSPSASQAGLSLLYASNSGDNTVSQIDSSGTVTTFASSGLDYPRAWVQPRATSTSPTPSARRSASSPTGASLGTFASSGLITPTGLAFDTAGNLYVANFNDIRGTISEFSPTGASRGSSPRGWTIPRAWRSTPRATSTSPSTSATRSASSRRRGRRWGPSPRGWAVPRAWRSTPRATSTSPTSRRHDQPDRLVADRGHLRLVGAERSRGPGVRHRGQPLRRQLRHQLGPRVLVDRRVERDFRLGAERSPVPRLCADAIGGPRADSLTPRADRPGRAARLRPAPPQGGPDYSLRPSDHSRGGPDSSVRIAQFRARTTRKSHLNNPGFKSWSD